MQRISLKTLSVLLSFAMIISAFAAFGTISASAEDITEPLTSSDFTFANGQWASFSAVKDTDDGLITVTNPNNIGSDKGFVLKFSGLAEKFPTQISFVFTAASQITGATVAFGDYKFIQDITNDTSIPCVKYKSQTIGTTDTTITFTLPELCQYNTLYVSRMTGLTTTNSISIKSISVTYDSTVKRLYKFNSNINYSKTMTFADNYWATGQWVSGVGGWYKSTNRISITRKIPVKEGAVYTFTFNKTAATPGFAQVLTRVYKSGIGDIADGADLIASENQATLKSNFISSTASMEIATGSTGTSTANIDNSGTKIKIKEGSGGAFMLISLYSAGWTATNCATALTNQAADRYSLKITESFQNSTTTVISYDGSNITAPDACGVNPGETFIGWKENTSGNLYPAGYVFEGVDSSKNFTAISAKVETQEGAGVRWSNTDIKRGLKFTTYISGNVNAAKLIDYISPALVKTVISGNSKTVDVMNSSTNDGNGKFAEESNDTTLVFHGSVTEYQSDTSMLTVDFTAQGVATVTYADGTTMELASSTTTTRNMKYVAQAAYDALKDETTELATSKCALLKDVYGVQ